MTSRRAFLSLVGGAAAAWPLSASAQGDRRIVRIGILDARSEATAHSGHAAFRQRMEELGWKQGTNVQFEYRWADGDLVRLHTLAAELAQMRCNVLMGEATPTTAALRKAAQNTPIVFVNANDPVGSGFVVSLARPGGNVTGFVSFEPAIGGKWLELLKEIAPQVSRIALLFNPRTHTGQHFPAIEAAARTLSVVVIRAPYTSDAELERTLAEIGQDRQNGLIVLPDVSSGLRRELIVGSSIRFSLPTIFPYRYWVEAGGLAYYGTDNAELFKKAASYVDRILKGEKPAELPVQAPTRYELVINLKTAKASGLSIPPVLLARADQVIE